MNEVNPAQPSLPNVAPETDPSQEAYAQWLQASYGGLHEAVWHAHDVFWTTTGIFVPVIATATGYLVSGKADDLAADRIIVLYVLVIAVSWFWYGTFLLLRQYNRFRIGRLKAIEEQLNKYYEPRDPLQEFHYHSKDEHDRRQYACWLRAKWLFLTLPVLVTVIMLVRIVATLATV